MFFQRTIYYLISKIVKLLNNQVDKNEKIKDSYR